MADSKSSLPPGYSINKYPTPQPWVSRFKEEYQDGRPWRYAIFYEPNIDKEELTDFRCRIDMLLQMARGAVFGCSIWDTPHQRDEILVWPKNEDEQTDEQGDHSAENKNDNESEQHIADQLHEVTLGKEATEDDPEDEDTMDEDDGYEDLEGEDHKLEIDIDDEDLKAQDDDDLRKWKIKDGEIPAEQPDDESNEEEDDEDDDMYIDTARQLPKLREHFKYVRDHVTKVRKSYQALDGDLSGIPIGLLRNVFLVVDQDSVDSVIGINRHPDWAWIWAIDPDFVADADTLSKNGLEGEYCGYMRVRVQQLVNHFWNMRKYHQEEWSLERLWEAARESHDCAFVSVVPEEARDLRSAGLNRGTALRYEGVKKMNEK